MSAHPLSPTCPKCSHTIDAATAVDLSDATPRTGDIAVCGYCGCVMKFDGPIPLPRSLTPEEQAEVMRNPDVMSALITIAMAQRKTLQ